MGCQIVLTLTSTLNGTYAIDAASQQQLASEALYIQVTSGQGTTKFTNGQTTKPGLDAARTPLSFTTAQFIALSEAFAQYADALTTAMMTLAGGGAPTWPTQPVTIG